MVLEEYRGSQIKFQNVKRKNNQALHDKNGGRRQEQVFKNLFQSKFWKCRVSIICYIYSRNNAFIFVVVVTFPPL